MLTELVNKQRAYTNEFLDTLDLKETERVVETLLHCPGVIFLTGVGKSGLVAKKIAVTMVSTGTRAMYLSPTDAVHGDLGMVSAKDVFLMLSKSGESDELLHLIPAIRNKGATIIGIVCNPRSRLAAASHQTMTLPIAQELCPFDMAPTTSTTAQLLFGDLLTVALMRRKNFSVEQYALNHPSGRIGKRMIVKVSDLMLTGDKMPHCKPEDKVVDILVELSNKRCGCVLVVDEKKHLSGIFTDGDLRRALQKHGGEVLQRQIHELMTLRPLSINPEMLAWDAMKLMEADPKKRIMMLPVLDANQCVIGLIHLHDILQGGL